uniref:Uncharacterized protein n=1 Tax=uncultured Desulfobacterium sp. TaxID=201089 RepID=E1YMW5_9BACT|nr:unknown protein [uncultured Desulfobacterium sp.]
MCTPRTRERIYDHEDKKGISPDRLISVRGFFFAFFEVLITSLSTVENEDRYNIYFLRMVMGLT